VVIGGPVALLLGGGRTNPAEEELNMVVLFVVATFAVFIGADYLLNRDKYAVEVPIPAVSVQGGLRPFEPVFVDGVMMVPSLKYHPGHTWSSIEGAATARIGIDDFAGRLLAPVQKIEFPAVGRWIRQGERAFVVQQNGRSADVISPVEGEILQINPAVIANPDLMRSDPYGQGWAMMVHSPDLPTTVRNLLSGSLARHWMEDAVERLRTMLAPAGLAMAQEAGPLQPGIAAELNDTQYAAVVKEFLLN
jgi:glycine cleavage system H lipoate-binding protein